MNQSTISVCLASACLLMACRHYKVPVDRVRANGSPGTNCPDALQAAAIAMRTLRPKTGTRVRAEAAAVKLRRFRSATTLGSVRYKAEPAFAEVVDTIVAQAKLHDYMPERETKDQRRRRLGKERRAESADRSVADSLTNLPRLAEIGCDEEGGD